MDRIKNIYKRGKSKIKVYKGVLKVLGPISEFALAQHEYDTKIIWESVIGKMVNIDLK